MEVRRKRNHTGRALGWISRPPHPAPLPHEDPSPRFSRDLRVPAVQTCYWERRPPRCCHGCRHVRSGSRKPARSRVHARKEERTQMDQQGQNRDEPVTSPRRPNSGLWRPPRGTAPRGSRTRQIRKFRQTEPADGGSDPNGDTISFTSIEGEFPPGGLAQAEEAPGGNKPGASEDASSGTT